VVIILADVVNKGGRPLKYKTVNELQVLIDAYFARQKDEGRPLTVTGLAMALDMDRSQLIEYGDRSEFSNAIKEAKRIVQEFSEETLYTARNPVGAIFNLKNNWGWKDKQEIQQNITVDVSSAISDARARAKAMLVADESPNN
jgi:hypothetical protein